MAPRSFGKYEVLARLATGGAASIFLARQPGAAGFQKLVCLKTLLPERASDDDFVAMFLDEARLAARLNHPNCVQIYDLGRVRGVYYISMEYIFGETLWNLLTTVTKVREPLPASHVAHILASACDGLHHAHELKDAQGRPYHLVHRDVSPQNVMITFEGQTKVLDFGIAKAETGRAPTMAGIVKGKFSYMSPEQITGGQVDRRSDIYSLGIVLFECLASRRLYRGDSPEDIAKLILEHRAPRLRDVVPDIPGPLDEICAKALGRHPAKRFETAHDMGDALRNYLDDVRYNQSSSTLAKLLRERFGDAIENRRQVFEGALAARYDEAHLIDVLDARAVRDIDLFPDEESTEAPKDFTETGVAAIPSGELSDAATSTGDASSTKRRGAGWRVELDSDGTEDVEPISVGQPSLLTPSPQDGSGMTRLDPEEGPEGATVAGLIEQVDGRTQLDGGHIEDAVPLVRPAQFDPDATEDSAEGAISPSPMSIEASTPFDGDRTPLDALAEEAFEARAPSFGGAAAELEARLAEMDGPTAADTVDAEVVDRSTSVELVRPADTAITANFRGRHAPVVHEPAVHAPDPATLEPDPTPVPSVRAATRQPTDDIAPRPQAGAQLRFSLAAVLAAAGFGISVGIVIGMLLSRFVFGLNPTPMEVPTSAGRVVEMDG